MRIYEQKAGKWTEQDRLQIAALLVKTGYVVSIGREKISNKQTYIYYVDFNVPQ